MQICDTCNLVLLLQKPIHKVNIILDVAEKEVALYLHYSSDA
jgi:hypothetical protein